jgi:aspartate aminotransferase-like enzyme
VSDFAFVVATAVGDAVAVADVVAVVDAVSALVGEAVPVVELPPEQAVSAATRLRAPMAAM